MEAFFVSASVVALAEMGDKTQLLSLILAARFQKPIPIISGILVATLFNHAFAGVVGSWLTLILGPTALGWVLGISFLVMAAWTLVPDKLDEVKDGKSRFGVFTTTLVAFFLAEMGDKTQVATIALAAQYSSLVSVVTGTTIGMMFANVPVVYLGNKGADKIPLKLVRSLAAAVFAILGLLILSKVAPSLWYQ